MKSKSKLYYFLVIFTLLMGVFFLVFPIANNDDQKESAILSLNTPRTSSYWTNFTFIKIYGNWSVAASYDWCRGNGSYSNPYIIENITLNASSSPTHIGIYIFNSKNAYFIIRNCTIFGSPIGYSPGGGIYLQATCNGTIYNNNCSNNGEPGIGISYLCENNTIIENIVDHNRNYGIYLSKSKNNTISKNWANFNGDTGIYSIESENNTINENNLNGNNIGIHLMGATNHTEVKKNTLKNNQIYIYESHNNTIIENSIENSGISVYNSLNTTITDNTVLNDFQFGICLRYSNFSIVSRNYLEDHAMAGIYLENTEQNLITSNIARNNLRGIILGCSNNNIVSDNTIEKNSEDGILVSSSNSNTFYRNSINDNNIGIMLVESNNNIIRKNIFLGNGQCIAETNCSGNIIENNFCSNEVMIWIWIGIILGIISLTIILVIIKKKKSSK